MCSSNTCCFHFSHYIGCYIIAFINILMSITISIAAIIILEMDPGHTQPSKHHGSHPILLSCLGIEKRFSNYYVLTSLVISTIGLLFSSVLIYGLKKKKPSLVLSYFVFGVLQAIIILLASLLELIHQLWELSLVQILITIVYIHGLIVVHRVYEEMWQEAKNSVLDQSFLIDNEVTENCRSEQSIA